MLAIETATSLGSVALLEDGAVVIQRSESVPQHHLEWLAPAIHQVLDSVGWTPAQIDAVAVSTGPGSFTSLRIGIATAMIWARSRGLPAIGVPTLAAVALGTQAEGLVCPVLDVRRSEVALALFTRDGGIRRVMDDVVGPMPQVVTQLPAQRITFSGDGLIRYASVVQAARADAVLAPRDQWFPTATAVGRLAWERLARGEHNNLLELRPMYVRAPTDDGSAQDTRDPP